MKLYDVKDSPNCFEVRVLARELQLTLELVPIDLGQPKTAATLPETRPAKCQRSSSVKAKSRNFRECEQMRCNRAGLST
jgi:hypothetical protein